MSKKSRRDPVASKLDSAKKSSIKVLSGASDYAAPKLREAADKANQQVESLAEKARPQVEALTEKARPQVEAWADKANQQVHALADRLDTYRPQATERAGKVASTAAASLAAYETPQILDDLAVRLTGDKKAMKKARKALTNASKRISKETAIKKSSGGRKALVWTLLAGSAAGIGYYVWKKAQPVEDPWSTPLPNNRPADARPVGSTPASRQGTAPQVTQTTVPAGKDDADPKH